MEQNSKRQKTGGRKKGTPNKLTVIKQAMTDGSLTGADSLKFFVQMLADVNQPIDRRIVAAKELLPYQYSKKPTTEIQVQKSLEDLVREFDERDRGEGEAPSD